MLNITLYIDHDCFRSGPPVSNLCIHVLSGQPIRSQYPGHVITNDQSQVRVEVRRSKDADIHQLGLGVSHWPPMCLDEAGGGPEWPVDWWGLCHRKDPLWHLWEETQWIKCRVWNLPPKLKKNAAGLQVVEINNRQAASTLGNTVCVHTTLWHSNIFCQWHLHTKIQLTKITVTKSSLSLQSRANVWR